MKSPVHMEKPYMNIIYYEYLKNSRTTFVLMVLDS